MAKRWFWEKSSEDCDVAFAIMFLEDNEDRAMTFCFAHTQQDAQFIMDAIVWKEALEGSRKFCIPESRKTVAKRKPIRKTKPRAKSRKTS